MISAPVSGVAVIALELAGMQWRHEQKNHPRDRTENIPIVV